MSDTSEVIIGKMVLVGEMAVGKSNMVSQYVKAEFHDEYISTNGANFDHKTLFIEEYNKTLNMHIWDTAGQERFRSLSRIFYKDAKAAILVYDVTRRGTFEELKNGIGNIKTGINIFSQIDKPTSNNGIWIKNNKMYENIDFRIRVTLPKNRKC